MLGHCSIWFRKADFTKSFFYSFVSQNGGIKFCKGCDIQLSWKQQELKMFVMSSGLQGLLWASILAMCSNKWALLEIFRFIFFWRNIVYVYIWYWTGGKSFQDLLPPSQCGQAQCLGRGEVGTLLRSHESVRQFEGRQRKKSFKLCHWNPHTSPLKTNYSEHTAARLYKELL